MGYLANTKCYLVGPIESDKSFGKDWRDVIVPRLGAMNIRIYNPLDRPQWMKHIEPYIPPAKSRDEILKNIDDMVETGKYKDSQEFVREICLRYINSCDFVICYLSNSKTFGSTEELVIAANAKKPIIMIYPDGCPSLWIYDLVKGNPCFKNINETIDYLTKIDSGDKQLNPLKWIFLSAYYPKFALEDKYDW